MKIFIVLLFLVVAVEATACDFSLGAGPTFRATFKGESPSTSGGNVISAQCAFNNWIIQGDYFSQQTIKKAQIKVDSYPMLTFSRRWSADPAKTRLPPFFQFGLSFKEAQSCNTSSIEEIAVKNCNPLVPSPVSATFGIGFTTKKLEFLLRHTSNAGTSKPNGGQESLMVFYRF